MPPITTVHCPPGTKYGIILSNYELSTLGKELEILGGVFPQAAYYSHWKESLRSSISSSSSSPTAQSNKYEAYSQFNARTHYAPTMSLPKHPPPTPQ